MVLGSLGGLWEPLEGLQWAFGVAPGGLLATLRPGRSWEPLGELLKRCFWGVFGASWAPVGSS